MKTGAINVFYNAFYQTLPGPCIDTHRGECFVGHFFFQPRRDRSIINKDIAKFKKKNSKNLMTATKTQVSARGKFLQKQETKLQLMLPIA